MLATSKMTGLDHIGGGVASLSKNSDSDSKRSSTSSEEMLSTPKLLPESAHFLVKSGPLGSSSSHENNQKDGDTMLMTPVLTTPKTSDVWLSPTHLKMNFGSSSPISRSMVPSTEPPSELPMVSDINLRSPADGILAQRREKFRKKQQSSLSDSNSCDTPTSENSPRDLSMAKPSTPTLIPSSPTMAEAPAPGNFKHPHKPDPLRLPRDEANNDVPAHCTPSPFGTIPSPNWMVMKRYLDCGQMLKTPKQLDSSFFDGQVLPPPSSATPRSPKVFQNHSPRLPIPETPTDLSSANKFDDLRGNMEVEETEAAEDLSITSRKVKENRIKEELPSRTPPPPSMPHMLGPVATIKVEPQLGNGHLHSHVPPPVNVTTTSDTYKFPPVSQSLASVANSRLQPPLPMPASYVPQGLHNFYDRQMIPGGPGAGGGAGGAASYRDHHNASPIYQPNWPPATFKVEDPHSVSPPPGPPFPLLSSISMKSRAADTMLASDFKKAKLDVSPPKKRGGGGGSGGGGKGKSKAVPKDGSKRVYSCPHCQRSYDWNYNLNRHLKYECGKENAFQCARCGRKFPHKQNCVYHLKRKHKIVCDTIDQYVAEGLVLFKGSANPGGQQIANPEGPGGAMQQAGAGGAM